MSFPVDRGLPRLNLLFDRDWITKSLIGFGSLVDDPPDKITPRQLFYRPGSRAVVSYIAERRWDDWIAETEVAIEMRSDDEDRVFGYPDDPYLPGLPSAASASEAHGLVARYTSWHPHRLKVRPVRYRPGRRAVLRHSGRTRRSDDRLTLFARVVPPKRLERILTAGEIADKAGISVPRLMGYWNEGGVVWLTKVPGRTVRKLIRKGSPPDPELVFALLEHLWAAPGSPDAGRPMNVAASFRTMGKLFSQILQDDDSLRALEHVESGLRQFVDGWSPSVIAHNDFYDDQLIQAPDGHLSLVDFEEIGPGDPLIDIGTFLAHLQWAAHFRKDSDVSLDYANRFRQAALVRFGWDGASLAMREAYALFLISSNPVRHLVRNWQQDTRSGLTLAMRALERAA